MKPLSEMSDNELFAHGAEVLTAMCKSLTDSHNTFAEIWTTSERPDAAKAMLRHSLWRALNGVGDVLNNIDLLDEALVEKSSPLFLELKRRFS